MSYDLAVSTRKLRIFNGLNSGVVPRRGSSPPVTGTVTAEHLSETRGIRRLDSPSTGAFCPTVCPTVHRRDPERLAESLCGSRGRDRSEPAQRLSAGPREAPRGMLGGAPRDHLMFHRETTPGGGEDGRAFVGKSAEIFGVKSVGGGLKNGLVGPALFIVCRSIKLV